MIHDAIALVIGSYFDDDLFLKNEDEERSSDDLVSDLERAVNAAAGGASDWATFARDYLDGRVP